MGKSNSQSKFSARFLERSHLAFALGSRVSANFSCSSGWDHAPVSLTH